MDELPSGPLENIFLQLQDSKSLAQCSLVCRRWRTILQPSSPFWLDKCNKNRKKIPSRLLIGHVNDVQNRVDYRLIWLKNPYGRNLIKNDSGQERFKHWEIDPSGDDIWHKWDREQGIVGPNHVTMNPIEKPPRMAVSDTTEIDCCFATSFFECKKTQKIDLWAEGIEPWILNEIKPAIVVSEWHAASRDCGSRYSINVDLFQDGDEENPVDSYEDSCLVQQWHGGVWEQSLHKFVDYPQNVRYVVFSSSGQDTQFWSGFFGAKMAKASVTIEFE